MLELDDAEWDRTVVVIDRLATLGSAVRMPLSRSLGEGLFDLWFTLARPLDGSPTGSPSGRIGLLTTFRNARTNAPRSTEPARPAEACARRYP